MRRKRRNRGFWFPTRGQDISSSNVTSRTNGFAFAMDVKNLDDANGNISTQIFPLTLDVDFSDDDAQNAQLTSLADQMGQEWFLNRVVGKIFLSRATSDEGGNGATPPATDAGLIIDQTAPTLVSVGLFIAQASDGALGADTPLGGPGEFSDPAVADLYSPLEEDTVRRPWIWRRAWILGTYYQSQVLSAQGTFPGSLLNLNNAYPMANWMYGSVMDGPHMDAKTKRRIRMRERLWMAVSATPFVPATVSPRTITDARIFGYFDYRIHGALRRPRPKGQW